MKGYKVFTHDLCSPIQGGAPVWTGEVPHELPTVELDKWHDECAAGWNFTHDIKTGLFIAGLWPNGRPSRIFSVEATGTVVERGNKIRSDKVTIISEVSEEDICTAIHDFSFCFKNYQKHMTESQIAWRRALGRPHHDEGKIQERLEEALAVRGLAWKLKRFESARATWAAKDAWAARDTWAAWDTWATWDTWAAWVAKDIQGQDWAPWAAMDARAALMVEFASLMSWVSTSPDYLTRGLRSAYENGLELIIPTGRNELGWSDNR